MTSTPTGARQNFDPSDTTQLRLPSHRTGTLRRIKKTLPKYDYEHYSRLAGPLTQPDPGQPYKVQYRSLISQEPHRIRVALMLAAAPLLSLVLLAWQLRGGRMVLFVGDNVAVSKTLQVTGIDALIPMFSNLSEADQAVLA